MCAQSSAMSIREKRTYSNPALTPILSIQMIAERQGRCNRPVVYHFS